MIIDNFHIRRPGIAFWPFEANPPLSVDTNAVLRLTIPFQHLKVIAAQRPKVVEARCSIENVQALIGLLFDGLKSGDARSTGESLGSLVPVA
jgi:hypothetical protein